jgi:hypothetical protein
VAQKYEIDVTRTKDYINATKTTNPITDRIQIEAEAKIAKA